VTGICAAAARAGSADPEGDEFSAGSCPDQQVGGNPRH
jgi:hypothetical protein